MRFDRGLLVWRTARQVWRGFDNMDTEDIDKGSRYWMHSGALVKMIKRIGGAPICSRTIDSTCLLLWDASCMYLRLWTDF
jgi:hypothetical protein